jgi:hypothetical protein
METTNLYRVNYVYRSKPPDFTIKGGGSNPIQEKSAFVAAESPEAACAHILSLDKGNEITSASAHINNIQVAGVKPAPAPTPVRPATTPVVAPVKP